MALLAILSYPILIVVAAIVGLAILRTSTERDTTR